MNDRYTQKDCDRLRELMVNEVRKTASNGNPNYILLSGGIDSITALYALIAAGAQYRVINFAFEGFQSSDRKSVEMLQGKIGFEAEYIDIPSDWKVIKQDVFSAVEECYKLYGRVREVKVETMFALSYVDRFIPEHCNLFTGAKGDAVLGYNRTMNIMAAHLGEDHPRVIRCRKAEDEPDEFLSIFQKHVHTSVYDGEAETFILQFTMAACNKPQPKAIVANSFGDFHKKFQSYRLPKPFQKASNERSMFNLIAQREGYKGALQMFNAMHKAVKND